VQLLHRLELFQAATFETIRKLRTILLIGIAIRLLLSPFLAHPLDVYSYYVRGEALLSGQQSINLYLQPYYFVFILVLPFVQLFNITSALFPSFTFPVSSLPPALNPGPYWGVTLVPGLYFDLIIKLPFLISDVIIALLLYRIIVENYHDEELALKSVALWFLNPLVIWISSAWGMFDSLPALFTVISLYLVLHGKVNAAGVSLVLAIAMKYYAVVVIIPFLFLAYSKKGRGALVQSTASMAATGLVLFLPSLTLALSSFARYIGQGSQLGFASGPHYSGLTFWTAITLSSSYSTTWISTLAVSAGLSVLYYWLWRNRSKSTILLPIISYGGPILLLLLFYGFVAENFLAWLLPFAALLVRGRSKGFILYWALSIIGLVSSITNTFLPYHLLPVAPWIGRYLVDMVQFVGPDRVAVNGVVTSGFGLGKIFLSALGLTASAMLLGLLIMWLKLLSEGGGAEMTQNEYGRTNLLLKRLRWLVGRGEYGGH
jgi:hypothetical protein